MSVDLFKSRAKVARFDSDVPGTVSEAKFLRRT